MIRRWRNFDTILSMTLPGRLDRLVPNNLKSET